MTIKNVCGPTNIYGPISQTLFLGCSIESFSAGCGWNESQSELTCILYRDPCSGATKTYYDGNLAQQTTIGVDPGFIGLTQPIIGCPVYFRVDNFEYSGIVQSWEEIKSISGYPSYRVKISDPRSILQNAQLIIGEYAGGIGAAYNTFNVYGFMEQFGSVCPQTYLSALPSEPENYIPGDSGVDGAIFGSEVGGFGGAFANSNGMQWNRIKTAMNILTCSYPPVSNVFSPYGRILFKGINLNGYGLMSADRVDPFTFSGHSGYLSEYLLDLSELPNPGDYFRLRGNNISILEAITQVCDITSHDYYIELLPFNTANPNIASSGIAKVIKIRTVSRSAQPSFGAISAFIAETDNVISSSEGRELRNETTTSLLIGGLKHSIYQIEQDEDPNDDGPPEDYPEEADDVIIPYFGLDINENVIIPEKDDDGFLKFNAPLDDLNSQLEYLSPIVGEFVGDKTFETIEITEYELLMSTVGFDAWLGYTMDVLKNGKNRTELGLGISRLGKIQEFSGVFNNTKARDVIDLVPTMVGRDFLGIKSPFREFDKQSQGARIIEDLHRIYDWVNNYATQFYGRKYQVRVPYTCVKQDNESGYITTSEHPTNDGGWTEQSSIIKLPNTPLGPILRFKTDDGRLKAFVRFDNAEAIDFMQFDTDDVLYYEDDEENKYIYLEVDVQEEFVYLDVNTYFSPRVVITLPKPIMTNPQKIGNDEDKKEWRTSGQSFWAKLDTSDKTEQEVRDKIDIAMSTNRIIGGKVAEHENPYAFAVPSAACIPIKSNTMTYGPWVSIGPAGAVRIDHDEGLVPWEYGALANLNVAANYLVSQGKALYQVGEMGDLTIPGYPTVPIGAELRGVTGGFLVGVNVETRSLAGTTFSENNFNNAPITHNYSYYTIGGWNGTYGPNITDINVQVSPQGVQTRYQMRTFSSQSGKTHRLISERIKFLGKREHLIARDLRKFLLKRARHRDIKRWVGDFASKWEAKTGIDLLNRTPHEVFAGQLLAWDNYGENCKRSIVTSNKSLDLRVEMANDYDKKAFISMDGFYRPVSMDGDGGLPQFGEPSVSSNYRKRWSNSSYPPVTTIPNVTGTIIYSQTIDSDYLNPLSNPDGYQRSILKTRNDPSGSGFLGHDIEMLGRGDTGDIQHTLGMPIEGFSGIGKSDYYDDYRFLARKGPDILQQWGYDLDGFPIPNKADTYSNASGGNFESTGLHPYFLDGWMKKPETWPVGPIDLRWDRKRGVWAAPPPLREIEVELVEPLSNTKNSQAYAKIVDSPTIWNNGQSVTGYIPVTNRVNVGGVTDISIPTPHSAPSYPSGTRFRCYYDTEKDKYYIEEGPRLIDKGGEPYLRTNEIYGYDTSFSVSPQSFHGLHLGRGLYLQGRPSGNGNRANNIACLDAGIVINKSHCNGIFTNVISWTGSPLNPDTSAPSGWNSSGHLSNQITLGFGLAGWDHIDYAGTNIAWNGLRISDTGGNVFPDSIGGLYFSDAFTVDPSPSGTCPPVAKITVCRNCDDTIADGFEFMSDVNISKLGGGSGYQYVKTFKNANFNKYGFYLHTTFSRYATGVFDCCDFTTTAAPTGTTPSGTTPSGTTPSGTTAIATTQPPLTTAPPPPP